MTTVTIRMLAVWLSFAAYTCAADTRPMLNGEPVHDTINLHSVQRPEDALALLPEDSALAIDIIAAWLQSGSDSGPEDESAPAGEVIPTLPVMRVGGDLPWIPNRPGEFGGPYDLGAIEDNQTLFRNRFETP